jgi:aspartyl aminopeptidase
MILAYGQDDRVCAFTSLFAMLDVEDVERTSCCILVDKEEIGSVGATGMHSRFFENVVAELVALTEGESDLKVRRALQNSKMLSSDVSAAYDPMYAEAFEKRSAAPQNWSSLLSSGSIVKIKPNEAEKVKYR